MGQIDPPSAQEKLPSKSPALLGLNNCNISLVVVFQKIIRKFTAKISFLVELYSEISNNIKAHPIIDIFQNYILFLENCKIYVEA